MKYSILFKFIFTVLLFLLKTEGVVHAQQEGTHTLFMYNTLAINPGVAGSRDMPTFTLTARKQWTGIKGAPTHQNLSFHSPLLSKRLGIGLTFVNRSVGIFEAQTAAMALAYSPIRTKDFAIRIGLQGSARRLGFRFEDAEQINILTNQRPLSTDLSPRLFGNFGMGAFMTYKDCYMGFSVPFYYSNEIGVNSNTQQTALEQPHYYFIFGLSLPLLDNVFIRPATIFQKTTNLPWGMEINNNLVFKDKVTLGMSYRLGQQNQSDIGESMDFLLFYQLNEKFGIGASYDRVLSDLKKYTDGSFEVVLRYDVKETSLKFSNPRVF